MGSFIGHFLPGTFFLIFSTWWAFVISYRYIKSQRKQSHSKFVFYGSITMPCLCLGSCAKRVPLESIMKIVALTIHGIGEWYTGSYYKEDGLKLGAEAVHHLVMVASIWFASLVEILVHYGLPLPKKALYAINVASILQLAVLMNLHLGDREMLDHHLHQLLGLLFIFLSIAVFFEMYKPDYYWALMLRCYFAFLIGAWFIAQGYMIWPSPSMFKWSSDGRDMSLTSSIFAFNFIIASVYFLFQYLFIYILFPLIEKCYNDDGIGYTENAENERLYDEYKMVVDVNATSDQEL